MLQIGNVSAQERPPFSDQVVNYGSPKEVIRAHLCLTPKEGLLKIKSLISAMGVLRYCLHKMLQNINQIQKCCVPHLNIGTPQGVDIHISKAIGHCYDTDKFSDYKKDSNAGLYGEITVLVDPCIFYKGKRGNVEEMFAKLIIRINGIGFSNDKPVQVVIYPEKMATFHGYDVYWLRR